MGYNPSRYKLKALSADAQHAVDDPVVERRNRGVVSLRIVTALTVALTTVAADAQVDVPAYFAVQRSKANVVDVRSYRCKPSSAGRVVCDESEVSVSYYDWSSSSAAGREPERCLVTVGNLSAQIYEPAGPGRWRRIETGGMCGATIATTLVVVEGDRASAEQLTIDNPRVVASDPLDICGRTWGESGTKVVFTPVASLGLPARNLMKCSSIAVSPP